LKHFKIPTNSTLGDGVFFNSGLESVDLGNNVSCRKKVVRIAKTSNILLFLLI
jgi:hypothetical protein